MIYSWMAKAESQKKPRHFKAKRGFTVARIDLIFNEFSSKVKSTVTTRFGYSTTYFFLQRRKN